MSGGAVFSRVVVPGQTGRGSGGDFVFANLLCLPWFAKEGWAGSLSASQSSGKGGLSVSWVPPAGNGGVLPAPPVSLR